MLDEYDYKYDCEEDPYTYPGTRVLINKFDIRDPRTLAELERQITEVRILAPEEFGLPKGKFDLKHLQAFHKYLFEDIYDWAGSIRQHGFLSKGNSIFCSAEFIIPYANTIFKKMHAENFRDMGEEMFAERIAYYLSEVNAIHPFREGNGRATRLFFEAFARENGWKLALHHIPHDALVDAMIRSMAGPTDALAELIKKNAKQA